MSKVILTDVLIKTLLPNISISKKDILDFDRIMPDYTYKTNGDMTVFYLKGNIKLAEYNAITGTMKVKRCKERLLITVEQIFRKYLIEHKTFEGNDYE